MEQPQQLCADRCVVFGAHRMNSRSIRAIKFLLIFQQTLVGTRPPSNLARAQRSDSESLATSIDFRRRGQRYRLGRVRYYSAPRNITTLSRRTIIEQLRPRSGMKAV